MTVFFTWHRKHERITFSRSKIRKKILDTFCQILYCSLVSQQKIHKSKFSQVRTFESFFSEPRISRFGSKFQKFGNYFLIIFMSFDNLKYPFLRYVNQTYATRCPFRKSMLNMPRYSKTLRSEQFWVMTLTLLRCDVRLEIVFYRDKIIQDI